VTPQSQQLRQKVCGLCGGAWQGLAPVVISSDTNSRSYDSGREWMLRIEVSGGRPQSVIADHRLPTSRNTNARKARMIIGAIALVFVSLLSLAGFWLVNAIAHS